MKYVLGLVGLLSCAVTYSTVTFAAATDTVAPVVEPLLIETVIDAKALHRANPRYPQNAARKGKEGWVVMSYIIEPDGSVSSPLIESSSGVKSLERSALRAIQKWQYQPATVNGEPIQQCRNRVRLDFTLGRGTGGASRKFIRKYKEIADQIKQKQFELAKQKLSQLHDSPKWNLYEDAWFWLLQADYYGATKDQLKELSSLSKIVGNSNQYLPENNFLGVLARVFQLQLSHHKYADALTTFKRLENFDNEDLFITKLQPFAAQLDTLITSDNLISLAGEISDNGMWYHKLLRQSFGFTNIDAELYKMEVRCHNQVSSFKIAQEKIWNIPKSWGQCTIYVYGEAQGKFTLVEMPNQPVES